MLSYIINRLTLLEIKFIENECYIQSYPLQVMRTMLADMAAPLLLARLGRLWQGQALSERTLTGLCVRACLWVDASVSYVVYCLYVIDSSPCLNSVCVSLVEQILLICEDWHGGICVRTCGYQNPHLCHRESEDCCLSWRYSLLRMPVIVLYM